MLTPVAADRKGGLQRLVRSVLTGYGQTNNPKYPPQSLKVRAACVCRAGADHDLRAACSRPLLLRAGEKCWIRAWNRNNPVVAWYRCQQVALSRAFLLFFFFLRFSCSKILDRKEEGKVLYWLLAD